MTRLDLGIRTEDVTTFRLAPGLSGYTDEQQRQALYERVEAELAALPGVTMCRSRMSRCSLAPAWARASWSKGSR